MEEGMVPYYLRWRDPMSLEFCRHGLPLSTDGGTRKDRLRIFRFHFSSRESRRFDSVDGGQGASHKDMVETCRTELTRAMHIIPLLCVLMPIGLEFSNYRHHHDDHLERKYSVNFFNNKRKARNPPCPRYELIYVSLSSLPVIFNRIT